MKLLSSVLIVFTLVLESSIAFSSIFEDYFIKVPLKADCASDAVAVADRFQNLTGTTIHRAECLGVVPVKSSASIHQFSSIHIQFEVRSQFYANPIFKYYLGSKSIAGSNNNESGPYKSMTDCLNDLNYRTSEFERYSAIVIVSTCERAMSQEKISYVMRFDTAGEPASTLQSVEDLSDRYKDKFFRLATLKMISENQGKVVLYQNGIYYFYSISKIKPQTHLFARSPKLECERQVDKLKTIFDEESAQSLTLGCVSSYYGYENSYYLTGVWNDKPWIMESWEQSRYSSFEECESDIQGALLRTGHSKEDSSVGICGFAEGSSIESKNPTYQVLIFTPFYR